MESLAKSLEFEKPHVMISFDNFLSCLTKNAFMCLLSAGWLKVHVISSVYNLTLNTNEYYFPSKRLLIDVNLNIYNSHNSFEANTSGESLGNIPLPPKFGIVDV